MPSPTEPLRFLDPDEMEALHRGALRVLAEIGMRVDHREALERLEAAGCRVDHDSHHVLFPEDIVAGAVGHLENAVTFSPLELVIDDEIAGYVRRAVKGFEVSESTIDLELIRRVGIGGNYLAEPSTAEQFRELLHLSPFFRAAPWGPQPTADESRRWERLAREKVEALLANEVEPPLRPEQVRAVDEIVNEASMACP